MSQERAGAWANARVPSPRRSISEAPGLPTMSSFGSEVETEFDDEAGEGEDRIGLGMREVGWAERPVARTRRRRHSFNIVKDAPEPWQSLSR